MSKHKKYTVSALNSNNFLGSRGDVLGDTSRIANILRNRQIGKNTSYLPTI